MIQIILWTATMSRCWMTDFFQTNQMFQDLLKTNKNKNNLINMFIFHFHHPCTIISNELISQKSNLAQYLTYP